MQKTYHVFLDPDEDIFNDGTNLLYLLDELCTLGKCKSFPQLERIPELKDFSAAKCYTYWDIIVATDKGMDAIIDVFIFVDDRCNIEINEIAASNLLDNEEFIQFVEEQYRNNTLEIKSMQQFVNKKIKKSDKK